MMVFGVGSYVVHKKLAELGSGEITKSEMGTISIRFASGVRNFSEAIVGAFLEKTSEAPARPPVAAKRKATKKAAAPVEPAKPAGRSARRPRAAAAED
jgi:hypothetical protein